MIKPPTHILFEPAPVTTGDDVLLLYNLWQPPSKQALCSGHQVCWPNRDCSHPRSQAHWHSHLAPAPKPCQFFSDLGHRPGSPICSKDQVKLARGNQANQKSNALKQPLSCPVEPGHWLCVHVLEFGCVSVCRSVWERG